MLLPFFFITGSFFNYCKAQSTPPYDEVSIHVNVQRIGEIEIPALITDQTVYLPVSDIFDFLHIKNAVSVKMDSVSGSFINPESKFIIDQPHHRIVYLDKTYEVKPGDLIRTLTGLYLRSNYFGEVFGLTCTFSFRNLSVVISTELELPVIREMRQDQMRASVNKLKGLMKADTLIGQRYPLFHFGTADYSVINSTYNHGGLQATRIGMGLGGIVAGGETDIVLNYDNNAPFAERQQYYLWRLVNNESPLVKQISAGKIYNQSIAAVYAPLVGIQFTNTPTTYRRSFGTYTLSNHTEPNWIVELYVNGVLITYVKADASGFYTFNVPLVYGNSVVKLRFYGPYGVERSSEQNITIPFNFLPKNEFEYTAASGIVEDEHQSRFSRISGNYGLSKIVTVGGGAEYLSSITSGAIIPFVNTSVRLLSNLFLSGEYDHGVRARAVLNYNLSSGMQLEINDTWYKKGQTAISNSYLEDRKATLSFPIRGAHFSGYSRISAEQIILSSAQYTTLDWLLSSAFGNYSASIHTYGLFIDNSKPYVYTDLSVATRLFKNVLLTQQVQYEYVERKIVGIKSSLEKRVFKNGYLNFSYERNFSSAVVNTEFGLRYNFPFAQTSASVRMSNNSINYLQSASGSLLYDRHARFTDFNNHNSVGTGAIILVPFLDMNGNGRRDAGEPGAAGLKVRINGGSIKPGKDTTIRITDLEAYTTYNLELDPTGFDRVAWQLPKKNYAVVIDPNFVKRIEVPVLVSGEVSGRVTLKAIGDEKGQGRILISFYNDQSVMVARTVSEVDGYFTYLGLLPGVYSARIDTAQLSKLHLVSLTGSLPFIISRNYDGSVADGLGFTVSAPEVPLAVKDSLSVKTVTELPVTRDLIPVGKSITVQAAHFKLPNARLSRTILTKYNYPVILVKADKPYFNIRIVAIPGIKKAKLVIRKIKKTGFPDAYILKARAK